MFQPKYTILPAETDSPCDPAEEQPDHRATKTDCVGEEAPVVPPCFKASAVSGILSNTAETKPIPARSAMTQPAASRPASVTRTHQRQQEDAALTASAPLSVGPAPAAPKRSPPKPPRLQTESCRHAQQAHVDCDVAAMAAISISATMKTRLHRRACRAADLSRSASGDAAGSRPECRIRQGDNAPI